MVDGQGHPQAGLYVRAVRYDEAELAEPGGWRFLDVIDGAYVGSGGQFRLHGELYSAMSLVCVSGGVAVARLDDVPAGATDLRLVVPPSGSLAGSVVVEGAELVHRLEVTLERTGGPPLAPTSRTPKWYGDIQPDGSFHFPHVLAGTYAVSLTLESEARPMAVVEGVEVLAGPLTRDPRLEGLVIEAPRTIEVEIVDHLGQPVPSGDIEWSAGDDLTSSFSYMTEFTDGRISIPTSRSALDIHVESERFHAQTVGEVTGDVRIELKPWHEVRVSLDPSLAASFPDWTFGVEFYGVDGQGDYWVLDWEGFLDERGEGTWWVDRPGTWEVMPFAWRQDRGRETFLNLTEEWSPIEVHDVVEPQPVRLPVTAADVQAALDEDADSD